MLDSLEERLRVAEREITTLQAQVQAIQEDVRALAPLVESFVRLDERVGNIDRSVTATRESIGKVRTAIEERDNQATDERKAVKVALITLTGVILSAVIAATAAIIVNGALILPVLP